MGLTSAALLAGCGDRRHGDQEGPLSANTGEGAFAFPALAARSKASYRSFGAYIFCVHEGGGEIELDRVTYGAEVEPLDVEFSLRSVKEADVVMDGDEVAGEYLPVSSAVGRPLDFEGGESRSAGTLTHDIAGARISQPCSEQRALRTGFTELILSMKVDERGAHIPGLAIDYTVNGDEYTLETKWEMIVCGTAVAKDKCDDMS